MKTTFLIHMIDGFIQRSVIHNTVILVSYFWPMYDPSYLHTTARERSYTVVHTVAYRGGFKSPSPPKKIPSALQNRAKINPVVKTVKIVEFRTPTPQDVREKGSKILKLPPVRNCFTLATTNT